MHNIIVLCSVISFFTLIVPDSLPYKNKKTKQIIGVVCLLISYYYWNNGKLF